MSIPQKIPKIYKEYEYKDYIVGRYQYIYEHCSFNKLEIQDYKEIEAQSKPSYLATYVMHAPAQTKKVEIMLANGLDCMIEANDKKIDYNILTM